MMNTQKREHDQRPKLALSRNNGDAVGLAKYYWRNIYYPGLIGEHVAVALGSHIGYRYPESRYPNSLIQG